MCCSPPGNTLPLAGGPVSSFLLILQNSLLCHLLLETSLEPIPVPFPLTRHVTCKARRLCTARPCDPSSKARLPVPAATPEDRNHLFIFIPSAQQQGWRTTVPNKPSCNRKEGQCPAATSPSHQEKAETPDGTLSINGPELGAQWLTGRANKPVTHLPRPQFLGLQNRSNNGK